MHLVYLRVSCGGQARIQGVGAGARAHPWGGVSPFKMHYSIAFKHQFIIGRPPLGEILYPTLGAVFVCCVVMQGLMSGLAPLKCAIDYIAAMFVVFQV